MSGWIKSWFGSKLSIEGSLVRLIDPQDNYTKRTVFQNSTLNVETKHFIFKNEDYDPEQDQLKEIKVEIDPEMCLTHYATMDEETQVEGMKWINLNPTDEETSGILGFEFEKPQDFTTLTSSMPNLDIDEEGIQLPSQKLSLKNNIAAKAALVATTSKPQAKDFPKEQLMPQPVAKQEEDKACAELDFKRRVLEELKSLYDLDQMMYVSPCNLFEQNPTTGATVVREKQIGFLLVKYAPYRYGFDLVGNKEVLMRTLLTEDLNYDIDEKNNKFIWTFQDESGDYRIWIAQMTEDVHKLLEMCRIAQYESARQITVKENLSEEDQKWLMDIQEDESQIPSDEEMEIEFEENYSQEEEDETPILDSIQSINNPMVMVGRENSLGLYRESDEGIEIAQKFPIVHEYGDFRPSQMMLHRQDGNLVMLDPARPKSIFNFDVARGQIVDEWTVDGQSSVIGLSATNKLAPQTPEQTFLAMSQKGLFTVDPRVSKPQKAVQSKVYSTNPNLTCLTTTREGHVAAGSKTGEIRMYTQIGQNSKTNLPGLGDSIKSMDLTLDGEWMLATTEKYLLVIPTTSHGDSGFKKRLGKKKRKPKKLVIKPADIAKYKMGELNFTPARFNLGENTEENAIVTSTGKFFVMWNFSAVKKGNLSQYKIRELSEEAIKNEFKFNEENTLITHRKKLELQNASKSSG